MRTLLVFSLPLLACASSPNEPITSAPNVRARLASPTRLFVSAMSSGSITARHYTNSGWQSSPVTLQLAGGDVTATASSRQLDVTAFDLDLQPIDIPPDVFGKPAQLQQVRLALTKMPDPADATWSDADNATAAPQIALDLSWTIAIDNSATPLGTQHLPAAPTAVTLSGDGAHVEATLDAHASGAVWSWAGLLELDDLDLSLSAATID
jgi:hypothetical protein